MNLKPSLSFLKVTNPFPYKRFILILIFLSLVIGSWGGYRTHSYLSNKGCYRLSSDLINIDLTPASLTNIRFAVLGDVGVANEDQRRVAEAVETVCDQKGCDFVLMLGDNFMENGVLSVYDPLFRSVFKTVYSGIDQPFFPVLGNHDVRGNVLAQVTYSLKNTQWQMPNYAYQFKVGSVRFFALNTNCNLFGWLPLKDLLIHDSSKWTFAYGHHPIYSSGVHGDNELQIRWYWKYFLQEHIDFYLSGHNHHLEHLQQLGDETEFIVSGAGGSHYRSSKNRSKIKPSQANSLFSYQNNGFVWIEVSQPQVEVQFFNAKAQMLYQFTKKKT